MEQGRRPLIEAQVFQLQVSFSCHGIMGFKEFSSSDNVSITGWSRRLVPLLSPVKGLLPPPPPPALHCGVSYFHFVCPPVCPSVRLKKYWTDQLHFWWRPSFWPKEETIPFWKKKSPLGQVGLGGGGCQNLALMIRDIRWMFFEWL